MPTSKEKILSIAQLVRLDLTAANDTDHFIQKIASQMDDVLSYMDTMNTVSTDQVEPMYSPLQDWATPRADTASPGNNAEAVLANAPERQDTFFVVPPVL